MGIQTEHRTDMIRVPLTRQLMGKIWQFSSMWIPESVSHRPGSPG